MSPTCCATSDVEHYSTKFTHDIRRFPLYSQKSACTVTRAHNNVPIQITMAFPNKRYTLCIHVSYDLLCTVMLIVSSCVPYGLVTLQVYWMLWWSADTGSSSKVSDWLLELATVMPSLIHLMVVTSKSVEHTIDTVSLMVSGVATGLSCRPTDRKRETWSNVLQQSVYYATVPTDIYITYYDGHDDPETQM